MDTRGNLYEVDTAGDEEERERILAKMQEALGKLEPVEDHEVERVRAMNRTERRVWLAEQRRKRRKGR